MLQKWKSTINIPAEQDATSVEEREQQQQRDGETERAMAVGNRQLAPSGEQRLETLRERASTRAGPASRCQAGLREEEERAAAQS